MRSSWSLIRASIVSISSSFRRRGWSPRPSSSGVPGVVVVLLHLDPRVGGVLDGHGPAEVLAGLPCTRSASSRTLNCSVNWLKTRSSPGSAGVSRREGDAGDGVADVEVAARLAALPVDGQRVADRGLDAEPVERGPEDLVVVEARGETRVERRFVGLDAVHHALVEVGRAEAPDPAWRNGCCGCRGPWTGGTSSPVSSGRGRCAAGRCGRPSGSPLRCRCRASRTRPSCRA